MPRNFLMWIILGLGYGLLIPFLTGAFLPFSVVSINFALGVIELGDLLAEAANGVLPGAALRVYPRGT